MQLSDLREAREFARRYGCKALVYGPPGSGKTPVLNTAPRPVLMACEPGLLSMRNSKVPTWEAYTGDRIDEFFRWLFTSNETKNFDTVGVDSTTQMAEIYLKEIENGSSKSGNKKHGLQAYGDMARKVMTNLEGLYYLQNKHTYLIAKQEIHSDNGSLMKRPYYPGNMLDKAVPHLYDAVLQLDIQNIPGAGQHKAFRCISSIDVIARNRTGTLNEFEPPDFGAIVNKSMV